MKKRVLFLCALLLPFAAFTAEKAQQTLSIIKPDAVEARHIGEIAARFEKEGLRIIGMRMLQLSQKQAEQFYSVHQNRPFFKDLVAYMISGPVVVQVLEGKDAVEKNRALMGATDPKKAQPGTLRADFGTDVQRNAVHGSDSEENAKKEIAFFFAQEELFSGRK